MPMRDLALRAAAAVMLILGMFAFTPGALAADAAGKVSRLKGEASVIRAGQTLPLTEGAGIEANDRLKTGKDARLELTMADDTKLTLGADAELVIDEFVFKPAESKGSALLDVVKGAFRFTTGKLSGMTNKDVRVKTGFANLAVRGTDFWGGPIDDSNGVLVLDGTVEVKTKKGSVTLTKGLGTMVEGIKHKPAKTKAWKDDKIARAIATIAF